MSTDYWLGFVTLPLLVALLTVVLRLERRASEALGRRGFSIDAKARRRVNEVSNYVFRRNIWWERRYGPVFVGHWYRDEVTPQVNRWVGFGSPYGPCLVVYRKTDLGGAE